MPQMSAYNQVPPASILTKNATQNRRRRRRIGFWVVLGMIGMERQGKLFHTTAFSRIRLPAAKKNRQDLEISASRASMSRIMNFFRSNSKSSFSRSWFRTVVTVWREVPVKLLIS